MIGKVLSSVKESIAKRNDSLLVSDEIVQRFARDPSFPYLVSFPRTGSHWLRMVMELCLNKPALVRVFFSKDATDFTCIHAHDVDLNLVRENVIYLYRNPVDTLYSQVRYHKIAVDDVDQIQHWTCVYRDHLRKWLYEETFTRAKTVVTYEEMKRDMTAVFGKLCNHLQIEFDAERLKKALQRSSKDTVKSKTRHDQQVVNVSAAYDEGRVGFRARYAEEIYETVCFNDELREQFGAAG